MKYSSQEINRLSWQEWNELMAKELNDAGFRREYSYAGETHTSPIETDDEPSLFIHEFGEKEINHLKSIGLLNNGRCPQCGRPINGNPGRFTSGFNHNLHFQICQNCVSRGRRTSVNPANKSQGCMIALLLLPIQLLKSLFIG